MAEQDSQHTGLLVIISGPSGVGKTTISRHVRDQLDAELSLSMTTRPKAASDVNGRDYHFVSVDEFRRRIDSDEMLEWAQVFGNYYGTPREPVERAVSEGRTMILEIDVQGAAQVKSKMPEAYAVFVLPPDEQTLLQRLRRRRREDEPTIRKRFARAKAEIDQAQKTDRLYDAFIVNEDLDHAVAEAVTLIRTEQARRESMA